MSDDELDAIEETDHPPDEPDEHAKEELADQELGENANRFNFFRWARPTAFIVVCVLLVAIVAIIGYAVVTGKVVPGGLFTFAGGTGLLVIFGIMVRPMFTGTRT